MVERVAGTFEISRSSCCIIPFTGCSGLSNAQVARCDQREANTGDIAYPSSQLEGVAKTGLGCGQLPLLLKHIRQQGIPHADIHLVVNLFRQPQTTPEPILGLKELPGTRRQYAQITVDNRGERRITYLFCQREGASEKYLRLFIFTLLQVDISYVTTDMSNFALLFVFLKNGERGVQVRQPIGRTSNAVSNGT